MINERRVITTDTKKLERIIKEFHKQLHVNKLDNQEEMNNFRSM